MNIDHPEFIPFLLRAKRATYAASGGNAPAGQVDSSRPASHDLAYREDPWSYLDTYLGGFAFIGEEAVWKNADGPDQPVWGMNYYGAMTVETIPEGFGDFLKLALKNVPVEAPYRGPETFTEGGYTYSCRSEGDPALFQGDETITFNGQVIYKLFFHGGVVI